MDREDSPAKRIAERLKMDDRRGDYDLVGVLMPKPKRRNTSPRRAPRNSQRTCGAFGAEVRVVASGTSFGGPPMTTHIIPLPGQAGRSPVTAPAATRTPAPRKSPRPRTRPAGQSAPHACRSSPGPTSRSPTASAPSAAATPTTSRPRSRSARTPSCSRKCCRTTRGSTSRPQPAAFTRRPLRVRRCGSLSNLWGRSHD